MEPGQGIGRRAAMAGVLGLAGCQAAAPAAPAGTPAAGSAPTPVAMADLPVRLSPDQTGYIALVAPINTVTRDLYIRAIDRLLAVGARQIDVLISSPGGVVTAARDMIGAMERARAERGITFITHNVGVVASAACYVFLAGQQRRSVPRGSFLFHAAGVAANGLMTGPVLQEASRRLQEQERFFQDMLKARTRLNAGEIASFLHRTVILTADEARRDGIVDEVADVQEQRDTTVINIRATPAPNQPATAGAAATGPAPPRLPFN